MRYNVFSGQQSERRACGGVGISPLSEEKGLKMKILMIGLDRMGGNRVRRLSGGGHAVKVGK